MLRSVRRRQGAAALAVAIASSAPIVARAGYSLANTAILNSNGLALAGVGNLVGGYESNTNDGFPVAVVWNASTNLVNLTPPGWAVAELLGMSAAQQVGFGQFTTSTPAQAMLWNGSSSNYTILHPLAFDSSKALGIAGNQQVGEGTTAGVQHALLWFGSASTYVDLNPATSTASQANATNGSQQVGYATIGGHSKATLWNGSAANFTNLHPAGYTDSEALGISGSQTVGDATVGGNAHAGLWNGTTFTDLNPSGATSSAAYATNGNLQVGDAQFSDGRHALAWNGINFLYTDLQQYVPISSGHTDSYARAVDAYGDVFGYTLTIPSGNLQFPHFSAVAWYVGDVYRGGGLQWDDPNAWLTPPSSGDLLITPTTASALSLQYPNRSMSFGNVYVDTLGAGSMQLNVSIGTLTTATDLVGFAGNGTLAQTGGLHTVTGTLELGSQASGVGTYNLSGTATLSAASETIGNAGTGVFNQTAGSNAASNLQLAVVAGSSGSYTLSGGTLTVNGTEQVGGGGTGFFTQSGGKHSATTLNLAIQAGSTGTFTMNGAAVFNVSNVSVGGTALFTGGTATLNVNAGTMTATGTIRVGNASSAINVAGGALVAQGVANAGSYAQTGGTATMTNLTGTGTASVGGGAGAALLTVSSFNQNALAIAAGGTVRVALAAASNTNVATSLSITGGTLDLNNHTLVTATPANTIRQYLLTGYATGAWNGSAGVTSSVVTADSSHKSIAYLNGANTNNASLSPALTNAANVLIRPSLIGDFNIDGKVDRFDIRAFNARNNFNDGLTTHDWSDGDLNFDGKVDRFDIRAFNAGNNFNSGVTFVAEAQSLTSASPAGISDKTTVGRHKDGKPDLLYNPTTGDVIFSYDGYLTAAGTGISEVDIQSAKGTLRFGNATGPSGASKTANANDVDFQYFYNPASPSTSTVPDGADFGNIFPIGLQPSQLVDNDMVVNFFVNTNASPNAFVDIPTVPEPATLSLIGVAAAGLLSRKRRRAVLASGAVRR